MIADKKKLCKTINGRCRTNCKHFQAVFPTHRLYLGRTPWYIYPPIYSISNFYFCICLREWHRPRLADWWTIFSRSLVLHLFSKRSSKDCDATSSIERLVKNRSSGTTVDPSYNAKAPVFDKFGVRFKHSLFSQRGPLIAPAGCDSVLYRVGINRVDN